MADDRWLQDEERHVSYRADYLERAADLDEKRARVLALRELGYSVSGIAERVEQTEPTVKGYLEELFVRFGQTGVETQHPDEIATDEPVEEVTAEEILELPEQTRDHWVRMAEKHAHVAPEWFGPDAALEAREGAA